MFEVLEKWSGEGVLALRVSGKLMHEDYESFLPKFEEAFEKHGAIRCLIDMVDLEGVELRAVWDELNFDLKHATNVSRCAVVGDRAWERWATAATHPILLGSVAICASTKGHGRAGDQFIGQDQQFRRIADGAVAGADRSILSRRPAVRSRARGCPASA